MTCWREERGKKKKYVTSFKANNWHNKSQKNCSEARGGESPAPDLGEGVGDKFYALSSGNTTTAAKRKEKDGYIFYKWSLGKRREEGKEAADILSLHQLFCNWLHLNHFERTYSVKLTK